MPKRKRLRLPNGFGQITEIKNKRLRKPFRAMVTVGKRDDGRPICKLLKPQSYFETYNDAYKALIQYHDSPYKYTEPITMNELYERWAEYHFNKLSPSRIKTLQLSWKYCSDMHNLLLQDFKVYHLKTCIDTGYIVYRNIKRRPSEPIKHNMKMTVDMMLSYAVEHGLIDSNPLNGVKISIDKDERKLQHKPITPEEFTLILNRDKTIYDYMFLTQCYMGWRPGEVCTILTDNVNIKERYIIGGLKTDNGKNRKVPIHSAILPLITKMHNQAILNGSKTLFNANGHKISYNAYYRNINIFNHSLHDGRLTYVTLAKKYNVDEYAIKYIVGHSIQDLTENVYTERDFSWLIEQNEKIKFQEICV